MGTWAAVSATRLLAPIAIAGFWLAIAAPAHAGTICAGSGCATSASATGEMTQAEVSKPVTLSRYAKRAAKKSALRKRVVAKRTARSAKSVHYSRVAARVKKAGKKFTAAKPASSEPGLLDPAFANARAEMAGPDVRRANAPRVADAANDSPIATPAKEPETNMQLVAADQVNDIDRAAENEAAASPKPEPRTVLKAAPQDNRAAIASNESTWDQTSLIGKLFVAFGGLLTLASAARFFIA